MPEIPLVPACWRLPAHPASVRRARYMVNEALPQSMRARLGADLSLLTSELVTNALRHGTCADDGGGPVELVLWPADGHYWLAVSDPGTGGQAPKPAIAYPGAESEAGRGLWLVDSVASVWTVRPRAVRGTSVIAGLALHPEG